MALPAFTHIHCSSRYDRSVSSLEIALDNWMKQSSIITLTEVANNARAAAMNEVGWGHWNAPSSELRRDECAIVWNKQFWREQMHMTRVLHGPFLQEHRTLRGMAACTNLLKHQVTGHTLMITVAHMPLHAAITTPGHRDAHWDYSARASFRMQAYKISMRNWGQHIRDQIRQRKPDAVLVAADWNLNLKLTWVRNYLDDSFGPNFHQAWTRFPTSGGSLHGGPVAPLGAPGKGYGDRIIDGSIINNGLRVSTHPNLMATSASSDHRPYKEGFTFTAPAGHPGAAAVVSDPVSGDVQHGTAWWGFGDYMDDELYPVETAVEATVED